jgi:hypothetical protein
VVPAKTSSGLSGWTKTVKASTLPNTCRQSPPFAARWNTPTLPVSPGLPK